MVCLIFLDVDRLKFFRPPPREDAKAFITQAFPRVDVGPTVLVEVRCGLMLRDLQVMTSIGPDPLPGDGQSDCRVESQ